MSNGALSGLLVLEVASYVSGPFAGMLLSDLGAEVVKIEPPGEGDRFAGGERSITALYSDRSIATRIASRSI
jgi:crotonobetainyl-CoA:carnitine CoA-transferase CaiB-like acyl-CoA transferase